MSRTENDRPGGSRKEENRKAARQAQDSAPQSPPSPVASRRAPQEGASLNPPPEDEPGQAGVSLNG